MSVCLSVRLSHHSHAAAARARRARDIQRLLHGAQQQMRAAVRGKICVILPRKYRKQTASQLLVALCNSEIVVKISYKNT